MRRLTKMATVLTVGALALNSVAGIAWASEYEMTEPADLTFAAQEVGTAAYNWAAALQTVMLKELPEGTNIAITTTSPGGAGAPIIVNGGDQCNLTADPAAGSCNNSCFSF